ncbi:hypothetical protein E2C01_052510 [Portunus trituberculatus]|uniref:Uncharacterized protein n=1 Tax=Portunus trituberculatus TaxID=210409 RepID=A0A5B7GPK0_PORTR|nr:hypothetical protein [Portunus trituberculatus]
MELNTKKGSVLKFEMSERRPKRFYSMGNKENEKVCRKRPWSNHCE